MLYARATCGGARDIDCNDDCVQHGNAIIDGVCDVFINWLVEHVVDRDVDGDKGDN